MAKIPDKAEHQRRFTGLTVAARRSLVRSVNRGKAVDDRRLAPLAVGVARRQAKFWRFAWLLGPLVGVTSLFTEDDLMVVLLNAAIGTVVMGLMSWFWYRRARRSETLNMQLAESRHDRDHGAHGTGPTGRRARSHLPGRAGTSAARRSPAGTGQRTDGDDPFRPESHTTPPPGQRPYKPRGSKRR